MSAHPQPGHLGPHDWRKSSYSGGNGGDCVEVAARPDARRVLVRDSKDASGPRLAFSAATWRQFVAVTSI
ncbi:MAG TPA: DUF397 domain-containing protein [Streptosporangiaceae bacterium]|nr:DUF397 domain-containing protein [Streptosporangiaceae bacterium]